MSTEQMNTDKLRELPAKWRKEADEIVANNMTCNANSIRARADELEYALPELLDELDRLRKDAGWQPIETAPKDGKLFLGWVRAERWSQDDGNGSCISCDVSDHDFCLWREMNTGGFYENMMGQIGDMQDITHWMPLPAPPAIDAAIAAQEGRE